MIGLRSRRPSPTHHDNKPDSARTACLAAPGPPSRRLRVFVRWSASTALCRRRTAGTLILASLVDPTWRSTCKRIVAAFSSCVRAMHLANSGDTWKRSQASLTVQAARLASATAAGSPPPSAAPSSARAATRALARSIVRGSPHFSRRSAPPPRGVYRTKYHAGHCSPARFGGITRSAKRRNSVSK